MFEIAFTAVPLRSRRDGWTPERQRVFIAALASGATVGAAAGLVGRSRQSAYALLDLPGSEDFNRAWTEAMLWRRRARVAALLRAHPKLTKRTSFATHGQPGPHRQLPPHFGPPPFTPP